MFAEFSKLCKRLAIAAAVSVLLPLGTAVLLNGANAAASAGSDTEQSVPHKVASLDTLGRARAVSWISSGHIARP